MIIRLLVDSIFWASDRYSLWLSAKHYRWSEPFRRVSVFERIWKPGILVVNHILRLLELELGIWDRRLFNPLRIPINKRDNCLYAFFLSH